MTPSVSAPATSVAELARELAAEIADLPRLSRVIEGFLRDADRDTARAEDLARALERDPVLQGWVLRQANSGFFKLARPVRTVAEACVVLGTAAISRLVYAVATRDLLQRRLSCYRYPGHGFWLHSLAAGSACRGLADLLGPRSPLDAESAFVAGLLHDVGKLLLDRTLPRAGGPRHVTIVEERQVTGRDHALVSGAVAWTWSLPGDLVTAIVHHHDPAPAAGARLVAMADLLVRHWGLGIWTYPKPELDPPLPELLDLAGDLPFSGELLTRWCADLQPVVAGLPELVQAIGHGAPPELAPAASRAEPETVASSRGSRRRAPRHAPRRPPRRRRKDR